MANDEYQSTIPARELAKSRWDYRSHGFIRDMSQTENNFQELYRRRPADGKVKHLWDPGEFGGRSSELHAAHIHTYMFPAADQSSFLLRHSFPLN